MPRGINKTYDTIIKVRFTVAEMAQISGLSESVIKNRIAKLGFHRTSRFSSEDVRLVLEWNSNN